MRKWWQYFSNIAADTRSLSAFRILLAVSLIYNLWLVKWPYAVEFYGRDTIIPLPLIAEMNGAAGFSVFSIVHHNVFAQLFILVNIFFAGLLLVGYHSRITGAIATFMYWNLLQASSKYTFGFDFFTFQLLFWACFLPLDNHFALRREARAASHWVLFALLFQIAWIYLSTGLAKYGQSWVGGYAVRNMLLDEWATKPLAAYIVDTPGLYIPMTYLTLVIEVVLPILIFCTWRSHELRLLAAAGLWLFHGLIFATYDVANFSLSGMAVGLLLLPVGFWERWVKEPKVQKDKTITANTGLALKTLVCFAVAVIRLKNLYFINNYSAVSKTETGQRIEKTFSWIQGLRPINTSFFTQFWKMFAPNPPAKVGWLALEIESDQGYYFDLMTGKQVSNTPKMFWRPEGMEYYLLMYARNFNHPDKEHTGRHRTYLKYWIPYVLKRTQGNADLLPKIFLTDYVAIVTEQKKPQKLTISYKMYPVSQIMQ